MDDYRILPREFLGIRFRESGSVDLLKCGIMTLSWRLKQGSVHLTYMIFFSFFTNQKVSSWADCISVQDTHNPERHLTYTADPSNCAPKPLEFHSDGFHWLYPQMTSPL